MSTVTQAPLSSRLAERIVTTSRRPAAMGAVPGDAISLAMGEPSEGTPQAIVDAAVAALQAGRTRYAPLTGSPSLRAAVAARLTTRHPSPVDSAQVVVTHGASAGLAATILALVNPGDTVIVPEPTYSLYADHLAMAGAVIEWVPNRDDGSIDVEAVIGHLPGARMLLLCSPGNPTGMVVPQEELEAMSEAAAAAGVFLVCDEAYSDIVFDGRSYFSSLDLEPASHVITCQTFSKAYAMTGWRLGYVVAAEPVADAINLVHRSLNGAVATFVQDAGETALATPDEELEALRQSYQRRRDLVVATLSTIPGVSVPTPQGAFYAFVRFTSALTSDEVTQLMAKSGVLVRSGSEFGPSGQGAFRISFATGDAELAEGLERISRVLHELAA